MADELEDRMAAVELLAIEILADVEAGRIRAAMNRINSHSPADEHEKSARAHAIDILEDALERHAASLPGTVFLRNLD